MENNSYVEELKRVLTCNGEKQQDIMSACEYANNLISLNLPVIFNKKHFSLLVRREYIEITTMMATLESKYYHLAHIKKKSGGVRTLNIPAVSLRMVQRWILDNILNKLYISNCAMGFCVNRSIVDNAESHLGKACVINLDLKDFFPSITQKQVFNIFYYYGYTIDVSYMLSRLCTYEGKLPQGAPTSPCLSNIVCLKLDKRLSEISKRFNAKYTRYADDITFSCDSDISSIIQIVTKIIDDEGFQINKKKTRILFKHQRQEVTGLLVNGDHVRVDKKYIKKFKQEIYYCKKYGVDEHLNHIECRKHFYHDHMYGKAYFIKMVDEELGNKLLNELDTIDWE